MTPSIVGRQPLGTSTVVVAGEVQLGSIVIPAPDPGHIPGSPPPTPLPPMPLPPMPLPAIALPAMPAPAEPPPPPEPLPLFASLLHAIAPRTIAHVATFKKVKSFISRFSASFDHSAHCEVRPSASKTRASASSPPARRVFSARRGRSRIERSRLAQWHKRRLYGQCDYSSKRSAYL